jgi:amino-acid N-acetyltransferase
MRRMKTSTLLREVVREYVRSQRRTAHCSDTASTVECHLLTELLRTELVTQQELADRLMLDKGWISRGVDRLVAAGLVRRAPDPADRRRIRLRLSAAGRARAAALDECLDAHASALVGDFAHDEERQLTALLARVLANLRGGHVEPPRRAAQRVHFRRALAVDWPAIERLLRCADLPVDDAAEHLAHFTVGIAGGAVVAVAGFELCGAEALLRSFVVAPCLQSQGHGSELLRHVIRDAGAAGVCNMYLLTQTAAAFFARHGFRSIDRGAAPPGIRTSREFTSLCPASAALMARPLSWSEAPDADH